MDYIAQLERRISNIERQLRYANKELVGIVTANEDPEGRNRIKVSSPDVYGETGESPWLLSRSDVNGPERGSVWTPKLGDSVTFKLRDGNPDVGEYFGGPRDADSTIPEEFSDPNVNGMKTDSGIIVTYDDTLGDYSFETDGGKLVLHTDGTMDIYGIKLNIHSPCDMNSDNPVYSVVTSSPLFSCPLFGPHKGSTTVKASD
jgi:phage baseplate assembly protein gpV